MLRGDTFHLRKVSFAVLDSFIIVTIACQGKILKCLKGENSVRNDNELGL